MLLINSICIKCACMYKFKYLRSLYVPYHEVLHVSCMTRSGAYEVAVVTLGQHRNDGCYSLKMAGTNKR